MVSFFKSSKLLFCILFVAGTVRFLYLLQIQSYSNFTSPYLGLNDALYQQVGLLVAKGDFFSRELQLCSSPLWAWWQGLWLYLNHGNTIFVRILNVLLGVGTVSFVFLISRQVLRSIAISGAAAFFAAIYGPYLVFDTSLNSATLGNFLLIVGIWLFLYGRESKNARIALFLAGLFLAFAFYFIVSSIGFFILPVLLMFLISSKQYSLLQESQAQKNIVARSLSTGLFLLGLLLGVTPGLFMQHRIMEDNFSILPPSSGIQFYVANTSAWPGASTIPGIRATPAGYSRDSIQKASKKAGHKISSQELSFFWYQAAWESIAAQSAYFLQRLGSKAALLLSYYELPGDDDYQYLCRQSPYLNLFPGYGLLLPLALTGVIFSFSHGRRVLPLYLLFGGIFISLLFGLITWQYRLLMTPFLFPFAGITVVCLARWGRVKSYFRILLTICIVFFLTVVSHSVSLPENKEKQDMAMAAKRMQVSRMALEIQELLVQERISGTEGARQLIKLADLHARQLDWEGAAVILGNGIDEQSINGKQAGTLLRKQIEVYHRMGWHDEARILQQQLRKNRMTRGSRGFR